MSSILYFSKAESGPYSNRKKSSKAKANHHKENSDRKTRLKSKNSLLDFFKPAKKVEGDTYNPTATHNDMDLPSLSPCLLLETSGAESIDKQTSDDTLATLGSDQAYVTDDVHIDTTKNPLEGVRNIEGSLKYSNESFHLPLMSLGVAENYLLEHENYNAIYNSQATFIQYENPIINPLNVVDNICEIKDIAKSKHVIKNYRRRNSTSQYQKKDSKVTKNVRVASKSENTLKMETSVHDPNTEALKYDKELHKENFSIGTRSRILKNLSYRFGGNNIFYKNDKKNNFDLQMRTNQANDENQSDQIYGIEGESELSSIESKTLDKYEINLDFSFNDEMFKLDNAINEYSSPPISNVSSDTILSSPTIQSERILLDTASTTSEVFKDISENEGVSSTEDLPETGEIVTRSRSVESENSSDIDSIISDFDDKEHEKETEKKFNMLANRNINEVKQEAASQYNQMSKSTVLDLMKSTKKIIKFGSSGRKKSAELTTASSDCFQEQQEEKDHIDVPTFRNSKKALSEIFNSLVMGTLHSGSLNEYTKGSTSDYSDSPDLIDIHDPSTFFEDRGAYGEINQNPKKIQTIQFKNTSQSFVYDKSGDVIDSKIPKDTDNDPKFDVSNSSIGTSGKSILKKKENKNIMFEKTRSYFEDMETFEDFIRKLDRTEQERMCKEIFNNKKRESQLTNYYKFYDKFRK